MAREENHNGERKSISENIDRKKGQKREPAKIGRKKSQNRQSQRSAKKKRTQRRAGGERQRGQPQRKDYPHSGFVDPSSFPEWASAQGSRLVGGPSGLDRPRV